MAGFSIKPLLRGALDAAIAVDSAIAGGLQELDPDGKTLRIIEHKGLSDAFIAEFREIGFDCPTTCAQACVERRRVVMRDIGCDPRFAPFAPFANEAGFRAMQSAPLLDSKRRLRGAMSTQFEQPHHPGPGSQRELDRCCRIAALALEARALGVERPGSMSQTARYAAEAAASLVGSVTPANRTMVLDAVTANLEVLITELELAGIPAELEPA